MEVDLIFLETEEKMGNAIKQYENNLTKISTGRANPAILNYVKILYYEELTPINQVATISVPDPRQLLIKPFEANIVKDIVSSINSSSLGVNAVNEGHQIRITLPELTTERRKELVKSTSSYTEQAKINIRDARHDGNKSLKGLKLPEDDEKNNLEKMQKLTNEYTNKIDAIAKEKENDLLKV